MSIKINVGGTIFETAEIVLRKIIYFNDLLNDTNLSINDVLFVDRPAHIFKHILALAIDNTYNFPKKYLNELGFYGVTCDMKTIYDPSQNVEKKIDNQTDIYKWEIKVLKGKINDLETNIETLSTKIETLSDKIGSLNNSGESSSDNDTCKWEDCYEPQYFEHYCKKHMFTCYYITDKSKWGDKIYCEEWGKDLDDGHFMCNRHFGSGNTYSR